MPKNEIVKKEPTTTALANWDAELEAHAKEDASNALVPTGNFVSFRGGVVTIAGQELEQLRTVVVGHVYENTYYGTKYDPDQKSPPICYAFGSKPSEMRPHDESPEKQSEKCATCPQNEWGSGQGKGKACGNRRRLALISADDLSAKGIAAADIFYAKLPVTSGSEWDRYVKALGEKKKPTFAVVTDILCEPDKKTQFKVKFRFVNVIDFDPDMKKAMLDKRDQVNGSIAAPYPKPEGDDAQGKPAKKRKFAR